MDVCVALDCFAHFGTNFLIIVFNKMYCFYFAKPICPLCDLDFSIFKCLKTAKCLFKTLKLNAFQQHKMILSDYFAWI